VADTSIEWTDKTWNPTTGCTRVSEGCRNCYAFQLHDMRHAAHKAGKSVPAQYAKPFKELQMFEDRLSDPMGWRKPALVFVNSMSDLFHKDVPELFIDSVFAAMVLAEWHTYQILTKRPERMADYFADEAYRRRRIGKAVGLVAPNGPKWRKARKVGEMAVTSPARRPGGHPQRMAFALAANVWLGTSMENQKAADERIPHLLRVPAAVRFLSCEPLLDEVILHKYLAQCECGHGHGFTACPNTGGVAQTCHLCDCRQIKPKIGWVIVGGESGPDSREFRVGWMRSLIRQCKAVGVPVFCKQLGQRPSSTLPDGEAWPGGNGLWNSQPPGDRIGRVTFSGDGFGNYFVGGLKDKKGGNMAEWPDDLRVREFPTVKAGAA